MKIVIIISIFLVILGLSIGGFVLITSNEDTPLPNKETSTESNINENQNENTEDETAEASSSSAGVSGSSGGGGSATENILECRIQHIQYSLKNFQEDITCKENFEGKCIKLEAICSVDVYNLDVNSTENFEIEYLLIDTLKNELGSKIIEENVNTNTPKTFRTNITIEDSSGIDPLSICTLKMINIPTKEICA